MAHNRLTRKRFATLLLACMMLLSFCAFVFAACSNTSDDDDETSETRTDTQTFANANFEYFGDSDGSYLIGSAESWTNSTDSNGSGTSASSSSSKSGIVDTSFDWGYDEDKSFYQAYLDHLYYDQLEEDDPDSEELENAEYYTDIDNYYDIPGWDVVKTEEDKNDSSADLTDEDTIKSDEYAKKIKDAAKALNPGTPNADPEKEDEENGTHVLMLHNYRSSDGRGTAQKYTSSSITLAAGTEAMFSVYVYTDQLTYNNGMPVNANRGAYIAVSSTVGGTAQDSFVVRNIVTNATWQQYTFYVKASDYASTTFSVVLGLGNQDSGTSTNRTSYVQGYAFFDELHYEVKTAGSFDLSAVPAEQQFTIDLSYGNSFTDKNGNAYSPIDASKVAENARSFALDLKDTVTTGLDLTLDETSGDAIRPTTDDRDNTVENSAPLSAEDIERLTGEDTRNTDRALSGWKTAADLTGASQPAALREAFENYGNLPFNDSRVLLLYSSQGAPYTASANSDLFSLGKDEYLLISFWVKTSDLRGGTGATISVVETGTETKFPIGAVDTTTLDGVNLTDDYNGKTGKYGDDGVDSASVREDIFDGWQQCFFFVANTTDETIDFTLEFNYGLTSGFSSSTLSSYVPGYAAFAGFEYTKMTDAQYNSKTTGTYAVEVALNGNDTSADSNFDDVAGADSENIKTGFGDPANYQGAFGNSHYVGGGEFNADTLDTAGLLDKEYAEEYFNNSENTAWMDILTKSNWFTESLNASNWWNTLFGRDSTQPLLIVNTVEQAYGYFARTESSISTSSYTAVTVRVKLSPGATANVYLIDTTAPETTDDNFGEDDSHKRYTDPLKYSEGISYRYDNSGNVVNLDPEDKNFSTMNNTLFSYQNDNGLWLPYGSSNTDTYYANLKNYTVDEENGNLLDSDGNVVYYASDEEGVYYRYYDEENDEYSVRVRDFQDTASGIPANKLEGAVLQDLRPTAENGYEKSLVQTVTNTSTTQVSDWIYVRFFIATGDESKTYRLEVWSGDRTGTTKNAAGSFVAFEMVDYGTIDADTFNGLVSLRLDALVDAYNAALPADSTDADRISNTEELLEKYRENYAEFVNGYEKYGTDLVYYLFSLYDDDDYASYDSNYSDSANSPYADYKATDYSDTVSFLRTNYSSENGRTYYDMFVNYGASDVSVASSSDSDDDTTEDTADTAPTYNVWLLVISIVLAAVLIFTLIILLIRKLLSNMKSRPSKPTQSYDNKRKRYIRKLKLEEAEKDNSAEDVLPEDDEITEEDIYKVETEEETNTAAETDSSEEAGEAQSESPAEEKKDE